jgi:lipopolysaccharide/colanic/teichoic acid biosynthesis glycosyltransferase
MEGIRLYGLVLIDRDAAGESFGDMPIVSNMQDVARYICREWIDEVYIAVENFDGFPRDLLEKCRQMGVTMHLQMMPLGMGKQTVEKIAGMPVITNSINIASPVQLMLKRLLDIFGGIALSIMAVLAIIIIGPIIKIKSPGPILYKQERIGQNGRRFKMFKIRSMYMDADARKQELMKQNRVASGMMFKLDFDPRIIGNEQLADGTRKTGIGEFIRRTSIDELPQGFNVLLNQMSLVGTRPPTVDEWEKYELHHRARLATKPGITGMWQVSGRSNITDFEEITRLDTEYIENWSIGLDIRILIKTVGTVLAHRGAM